MFLYTDPDFDVITEYYHFYRLCSVYPFDSAELRHSARRTNALSDTVPRWPSSRLHNNKEALSKVSKVLRFTLALVLSCVLIVTETLIIGHSVSVTGMFGYFIKSRKYPVLYFLQIELHF